jgi:hypothetical protein
MMQVFILLKKKRDLHRLPNAIHGQDTIGNGRENQYKLNLNNTGKTLLEKGSPKHLFRHPSFV